VAGHGWIVPLASFNKLNFVGRIFVSDYEFIVPPQPETKAAAN
jgi:hypothetical protein